MNKIQYNVGTFKGLLGTAVLYLAKTSGGTEFITYLSTIAGVDKWTYMSRTALQGYMATQDVAISSNIDISKLADVAPSGVLDSDGTVLVDNGASLPKLATGQAFYTLKGEGIAAWTADPGTAQTGGNGGGTVVVNAGAKTLSETLSDAVTWVTKNPLILILIAFAVSELLGLTNVLGLKKKKTARRRR